MKIENRSAANDICNKINNINAQIDDLENSTDFRLDSHIQVNNLGKPDYGRISIEYLPISFDVFKVLALDKLNHKLNELTEELDSL